MYRNAIWCNGHGYIAPGSHAMELYQAKKFAELEKHLAEVDKAFKKLEGTK